MNYWAGLISFLCLNAVSAQRIPTIHDGNDNTPISHLQYLASLQLANTAESFFCGGVFISRKAVLTLATCFYQKDVLLEPDEVRVVAGSQFRLDADLNTFSSFLENILIHHNFSRSSLESNLAIGFLSVVVPDNNIQTISIEDIALSSPSEGTKCDIYGWSLTTRFEGSPHLLSGEVEIEKKEKCDIPSTKITSSTICAGPYYVNGCETDDGFPLVCDSKVHGLIDFRSVEYCSMIIINRLGTYIDLAEFREWIGEHSTSGAIMLSGVLTRQVINVVLMVYASAVVRRILN